MTGIIDFIRQNKEWIFSGVGGALLISLVPWLFKLIKSFCKRKVFCKQKDSSRITETDKDNHPERSAISAKEFFEQTNDPAKTLLQQKEYRDKFLGSEVEWEGYVTSVAHAQTSGGYGDTISIFFQLEKGLADNRNTIFAEFSISAKNDLLELSRGDFVVIKGILSLFGSNKIMSLKNCTLLKFMKKNSNKQKS